MRELAVQSDERDTSDGRDEMDSGIGQTLRALRVSVVGAACRVAQIFNLLYRRLVVGCAQEKPGLVRGREDRRIKFCDTAD